MKIKEIDEHKNPKRSQQSNRVPTHLESQGINLVRESQGILLVVREFW